MKKTIIIIISIIIILLTILIILIKKSQNNQISTNLEVDTEEPELEDNDEVINVSLESVYKEIRANISTYFQLIEYDNKEGVKNINPDGNTFIDESVDVKNDIQINNIYKKDNNVEADYFISITIKNKEYYYIMIVDYANEAYQIFESSEKEFNNATENKIKEEYMDYIQVKQNDDNIYVTEISSNELITRFYINNYKNEVMYNIENSYDLIDEEYKKIKFNNYKEYNEYIKNNIDSLFDIEYNLSSSKQINGYNLYTCQTYNGRIYVIKATDLTDYAIMLDDYTIYNEYYKLSYNNSTENEKVELCIKQVIEMINLKDYNKIYEKLDVTFKTNNFPNENDMEEYIKDNFFDTNIIYKVETTEQANIYIVKVILNDSDLARAKKEEKIFIIKLGDNTDFTMSFNI